MEKTETGLGAEIAPADWDEAKAMFDEALAQGDQPPAPETPYPVTQRQWERGYDPEASSNTGKTPANHQGQRHKILGVMINFRSNGV